MRIAGGDGGGGGGEGLTTGWTGCNTNRGYFHTSVSIGSNASVTSTRAITTSLWFVRCKSKSRCLLLMLGLSQRLKGCSFKNRSSLHDDVYRHVRVCK